MNLTPGFEMRKEKSEILLLKKFVKTILGIYRLLGLVLLFIGAIAGSMVTFFFIK